MIHRLGFTGTRRGMTHPQQIGVREFLLVEKPLRAIHGGEAHADQEFHDLCRSLKIKLEVFPSEKQRGQQWTDAVVHPITPGSPLNRNHLIVARITHLLATPFEEVERLRSGTWATIRYARRAGLPITIILPNGARI